ncbi:IS66 family insertion sequence element accessory protein TnpB [Escherichia coli]|uniref:IS66 family insertion sequence element accessory protein TnpB n=1 Tax=Escherichia coli TaxID=562 RepID=UPI00345AE6B5
MSIIFNGHYRMKHRTWITEALRLHFEEHLPRVVAGRRLGVPKSTVCSMFVRFRRAGLSWPLPAGMRENGINDNLLFNWRHQYRKGGLLPSGKNMPALLPVTLTPEPDNKIPAPAQEPEQINTPSDSLCCELVLPAGTLRLKGKLTPALLQTLIREIKGSSH